MRCLAPMVGTNAELPGIGMNMTLLFLQMQHLPPDSSSSVLEDRIALLGKGMRHG